MDLVSELFVALLYVKSIIMESLLFHFHQVKYIKMGHYPDHRLPKYKKDLTFGAF